MSTKSRQILSEGADHIVYFDEKKPGVVAKVPKKPRSLSSVQRDLNLAQEFLGEFLPPTLINVTAGAYEIEQRRIVDAQALTMEALGRSVVRKQFADLLSANTVAAVSSARVSYDFFGLEGGAKSLLTLFQGHKGRAIDKLLVTPGLRAGLGLKRAGLFPLMPSKAMKWWHEEGLQPQMANVVLGRDAHGNEKLYVVDIALLYLDSPRGALHHLWDHGLLRTFFGKVIHDRE